MYGAVTLHTATWWCPHCRTLHHPAWDGLALPPGTFTWAVGARAAHLGGVLPSFARAAASLAYLTDLQMSARELELCTEGLGAAYTLPERPPAAQPLADVCYVAADAVLLHFRDATPWHEEKVFCTWHQTGDTLSPPHYWTADGPWDTHLAALDTLAEADGLRTARVVVGLGDGAPPLWTLLTALAPDAVQVLDWFHVQEHLATVAALLPEGEAWHALQRVHLRDSLTRRVLCELATLARHAPTAAAHAAARQCLGYLWRHRRRLDYATARARGYPIGSGRIESACKLVVQQRCKGPGMRWQHTQAEAVLHARCAWLNDDWARACRLWRATGRFAPRQEVKAAA
ncbi:MAG: hypothetical protein ACOYOU_17190 [Kiritimatiellia bacterium]